VIGAEGGKVIIPENPFPVARGTQQTMSLFIVLPGSAFKGGQHNITVRISDATDFKGDFPFNLLGPNSQSGTSP
jgi:hypothetical protein